MARRSEPAGKFRYERLTHRLMPWPMFLQRAAVHLAVGGGGVFAAVAIGTIGYHVTARLPWVDSFLNASMILAGMGPVDHLETDAAKLFAAFYALFSGLVFIALMGVVLAPWAHRVLHKFHMDEDEGATSASDRAAK
jgi:hypothetical protein